jgi:hypothetical protein
VVTTFLLAAVSASSVGPGAAGAIGRAGGAPPVSGTANQFLVALVVAAGLPFWAVFLVAVLSAERRRPRKDADEPIAASPPWPSSSGPIAAAFVVASLTLLIALLVWGSRWTSDATTAPAIAGERPTSAVPTIAPRGPEGAGASLVWGSLGVLATLAGAAAVLAVRLAHRCRPARWPSSDATEVSEGIAHIVEATIDEISADPDARRAVIAAYARLERELTGRGLPRRPSAAPFEYLEEALDELAVPAGAARSLTELFEIARFSQHRVDVSMKQRAIDALISVRRSLLPEPS